MRHAFSRPTAGRAGRGAGLEDADPQCVIVTAASSVGMRLWPTAPRSTHGAGPPRPAPRRLSSACMPYQDVLRAPPACTDVPVGSPHGQRCLLAAGAAQAVSRFRRVAMRIGAPRWPERAARLRRHLQQRAGPPLGQPGHVPVVEPAVAVRWHVQQHRGSARPTCSRCRSAGSANAAPARGGGASPADRHVRLGRPPGQRGRTGIGQPAAPRRPGRRRRSRACPVPFGFVIVETTVYSSGRDSPDSLPTQRTSGPLTAIVAWRSPRIAGTGW